MAKMGIVAFAFGVPYTIRSNRHIAEIALKNAQEFNAPVYTQDDVYFSFQLRIKVEYTEEEIGNPPPTLRIARGAIRWAKRSGFTQLWVVAAEPHLWRVLRDLRLSADEAGSQIDICTSNEIFKYRKDSWFCPDSIQEWTRSRKAWNKRERILRLLPFFIYKRIAS